MNEAAIEALRAAHPWPETKPDVPPNNGGWFGGSHHGAMLPFLHEEAYVLECGAFLGKSTRWLSEHAKHVVTIDHFVGSAEHQKHHIWKDVVPVLYETFCVNLWDYREKVTALRAHTWPSLLEVAASGFVPDMIYLDASHKAVDICADLCLSMRLWPNAPIIGDDWSWVSVRTGVGMAFQELDPKRLFQAKDRCWTLSEGE